MHQQFLSIHEPHQWLIPVACATRSPRPITTGERNTDSREWGSSTRGTVRSHTTGFLLVRPEFAGVRRYALRATSTSIPVAACHRTRVSGRRPTALIIVVVLRLFIRVGETRRPAAPTVPRRIDADSSQPTSAVRTFAVTLEVHRCDVTPLLPAYREHHGRHVGSRRPGSSRGCPDRG